jgi:ATP-dependent Clp protease protease subunit
MKNCDECQSQIPQQEPNTNSILSLSKERIIFVSEDFSEEMANNFAAILIAHANIDPNKEVTILIDSDGGSVTAFVLMHDIIKLMNVPIKTVCLSAASSAGALLLSSGTKGKRYALKNSLIMIHGLQCLFPFGGSDVKSSDQYLEILDNYNDLIMNILSENTGKSFDQVKEDCKKDVFLTPEEALEYGLIDYIVDDFNQIINLDNSILSQEIKREEKINEEFRLSVINNLKLSCDAMCNTCPKSESCEDIAKIEKYCLDSQSTPDVGASESK